MRLVLDTDVITAAMRSPMGASAAILRSAIDGEVELLLSVPLALEYESICNRAEHRLAAGLSERQTATLVNTVIALAEPVTIRFLWRPQLRDPNDEMVLETAVNGQANAIVTFNMKAFGEAPGRFGIELLLPRTAIQRIKQ